MLGIFLYFLYYYVIRTTAYMCTIVKTVLQIYSFLYHTHKSKAVLFTVLEKNNIQCNSARICKVDFLFFQLLTVVWLFEICEC